MSEKCGKCGGRLVVEEFQDTIKVAGRTFKATLPQTRCEKCGEKLVSLPLAARAELAAAAELARTGPNTGEAFRFMRKAAGVKAQDLAELLDVTPASVSRWENGVHPVDRATWTTLAAIVRDALAGTTDTLDLLRALKDPPKVPKVTQLQVPAGARS